MAQVQVDGLTINYEVQGDGDPLLLIPYLSADHACYAFQLPAYTEHFRCIAIDLPGTGESDKPAGPYSTEGYADQVDAFLGAIGVEQAHVAGVSLGAGVAMHLAARHPGRVRSLSLHSAWDTSDRLPDDRRRAVAHARAGAADHRGHGHPGHLPVVLHARDVRRPAGVRRHARGLRAQPPRPAAGRVPGPVRGGHRARRERGARRDRRSDACSPSGRATSSAPRASPSRSRAGSAAASWWSSSTCRTPGCTRTPRPSTARRSTSCCASVHDAHAVTPSSRRP